jgi:hypothetical protein
MSYGLNIKRAHPTLKRLEAIAGKGQRNCPSCRLNIRQSWPDPNLPQPRAEDVLKSKCHLCGWPTLVNLASYPEEEREALRLYYSFSTEDLLVNPKACALRLWFELRRKLKRESMPPAMLLARRQAKRVTRGRRLLNKLQEESNNQLNKKRRRLEAKYGEGLNEEIKGLIKSRRSREIAVKYTERYVEGLSALQNMKFRHTVCAELERYVWGESLAPSTRSEVNPLLWKQ